MPPTQAGAGLQMAKIPIVFVERAEVYMYTFHLPSWAKHPTLLVSGGAIFLLLSAHTDPTSHLPSMWL